MATTGLVEVFNLLTRRARRVGVREYRTPKSKRTFTQHELLGVLVLRTIARASYRTLELFVPLVVGKPMHFTTPHKAARRFGTRLFARVLVACLPAVRGQVVALDATGFSTSTKSEYYTWRIDGARHRSFVKTSVLVDTRTLAVLACRTHIMPRSEIRDAYQLAPLVQARHFVADKAYDGEQLHELLAQAGVQAHIPTRVRAHRGFWRMKNARRFRQHIYGRRALVETVNSVVKRRFGGQMTAHGAAMRRIEVLLKLISHNLLLTSRSAVCWLMISTQPGEDERLLADEAGR